VIVLDSNCAVSSADCEIIISYEDIFGKEFITRQSLLITDQRAEQRSHILLSIGDKSDL